jgi:acetyl-CoA synthetase
MTDFVWTPSAESIEGANVTRLVRRWGLRDYWHLVAKSQQEPAWFWDAVVEDLGIEFPVPYKTVLDESRGPEWATWFIGGRLNLAHNCVARWARRTPRAIAVVGNQEGGKGRTLTYGELWKEVSQLAAGLRSLGVRPGDRVALYLPMSPDVVVASHAAAAIGAIQVPIFSGFAPQAVAARLIDAEVKVVITADATIRRGTPQRLKAGLDDAVRQAPSVEHVVVLQRFAERTPMTPGRDLDWGELVAHQPEDLELENFDSEHPYLIAYTSGTTGRPKGAVHATGGFLVKVAEEVAYQVDLKPADTLCWVTDMGWLMGPWEVVGAGALGGSVLVLEGAPNATPDRLWAVCEQDRVSILGVSPTLVRGLMQYGEEPVRRHDLSSLRILGSTGEAWNPEPYRWLFETVGGGALPIINFSGGTEVGACFLSAASVIPLKACSVGAPALGMAVDVVDEHGRSLRGEVGELICRKPWPAMTRGMWKDPERYIETYWSRFPGVWTHGDWASVDQDGYWTLYGRSDDTLKVSGKRIGPAEFESVLVGHPAVVEAAAVGIAHPLKGEAPWCFCVLRAGSETGKDLKAELTDLVSRELGRSFRPERVVFVSALPKTRSAKIVRRALRALVRGENPGDLSTLENPEAIQAVAEALVAEALVKEKPAS